MYFNLAEFTVQRVEPGFLHVLAGSAERQGQGGTAGLRGPRFALRRHSMWEPGRQGGTGSMEPGVSLGNNLGPSDFHPSGS